MPAFFKKIAFHWWVLGGIVLGIIVGSILNATYLDEARTGVLGSSWSTEDLQVNAKAINDALTELVRDNFVGGAFYGLSRIFMRLLKMIVLPLVFFSLVVGIAGMGDTQRLGRIGLKTAGWYLTTSLVAIVTGLLAVNIFKPGVGAQLTLPTKPREVELPDSFWEILVGMVPENPIGSAAASPPDMLGVIIFALMFGIFLTALTVKRRKPMLDFFQAGSDVMMKMTNFIISLAPVGILALVAYTTATSGPRIFIILLPYVVTVIVALGVHIFGTLPLLVFLLTRRKPYAYMKAMSSVLLTAFSTASSAGTLAMTMEHTQTKAGISNRITSFVLPLGATVNMDGTALYECVTVLFIAQVHASINPTFAPLTLGGQLMIVFLALLVSIGAAAIPHAGMVMLVIILNAAGLPLEYTALIWAVDRVLDMGRTTANVWSDSCGALVVAHSEKEIDEKVLFA